MKKRILVTVSMIGIVALTCFAGNKTGTKEKKMASSQIERLGKELKLSPEQMTQLQKADYDFRAQRKKYSSELRKNHVKRQQTHMKALRKEGQKNQKAQAKMQRDYLKTVKKVMNQDQYVAFLENYWVKQHVVVHRNFSKSPKRGDRSMAQVRNHKGRSMQDGKQNVKRTPFRGPEKTSQE